MTGRERVESHMRKLDERAEAGDIAADYSDGAIVEMSGAERKGREEIAAMFGGILETLGDAKFSDVDTTENDDGSVEITWKLGPMSGGYKFWMDSEGMIERQRVWMGVEPTDW